MASKQGWKKWGLRLGIGLVAFYLLICAGMYFLQDSLVFKPTVVAQDAVWDMSLPDQQPLEKSVAEVSFPSGEGGMVNALHFKGDSSSRGVVLYLHGNGGNLQNYLKRRTAFLARKYDFFIFDYRGYGKSTGPLSEKGIDADAEAAYQYLLQHYPKQRIVIFGQSLGSGFAVRLAANHTPRQLYLETPYTSLADVGAGDFPWLPVHWLLKYPSESLEHIAKVKCPINLIHGTADEVIPYAHSERLVAAAVKATLYTCPGAGHNGCSKTPEYERMLDHTLH